MEDEPKKRSLLPDIIITAVAMLLLWIVVNVCYEFLAIAFSGQAGARLSADRLRIFLGLIGFFCLAPQYLGAEGLEKLQKRLEKIISWHALWQNRISNWALIAALGGMALVFVSGGPNKVDPGSPASLAVRVFSASFAFFIAALMVPPYFWVMKDMIQKQGIKEMLLIVGAAAALIAIFL